MKRLAHCIVWCVGYIDVWPSEYLAVNRPVMFSSLLPKFGLIFQKIPNIFAFCDSAD